MSPYAAVPPGGRPQKRLLQRYDKGKGLSNGPAERLCTARVRFRSTRALTKMYRATFYGLVNGFPCVTALLHIA